MTAAVSLRLRDEKKKSLAAQVCCILRRGCPLIQKQLWRIILAST
jgi:hypothetical protein